MNLKTGDRVKFLNDTGGGVVVALLDHKKAMVRSDDGFEIPVLISELVADRGNFMPEQIDEKQDMPDKFPDQKSPTKKEPVPGIEMTSGKDEELCMAILPEQQGSDFFVWLINNTSWHIHYVITSGNEEEIHLFDQGSMKSGTQMKIRKFLPGNLNNLLRFDIQVIFYKDEIFKPMEPVSHSLFVNPSEVYSGKVLNPNDYFDIKALILTIADFNKKTNFSQPKGMDLTRLFKENFGSSKGESGKRDDRKSKIDMEEVDLHIEAITDDFSGLSNSEIINLQLSRFKIALDTAIIHKTKRIVFIHGVGNGKLKFSLRKAIDEQYPDLQYQDASFKEYGYGATMVIIR